MRGIIAGNWKMNKTPSESLAFFEDFLGMMDGIKNVDVCIAPPFTSLYPVSKVLEGSPVKLGAQNMHYEEKGAFTGEVSPLMLKELGCEYVILGHSERRIHFKEGNELINRKIKAAMKHEIIPILCVGETLEERERGKTFNVVREQILNCLDGVNGFFIIAYEPVWAIGTGRVATPEMAEEVHGFIRDVLKSFLPSSYMDIPILYGGSVNPENVGPLLSMENINGVLVGGASLDPKSFYSIVKKGEEILG